MLIKTTCRCLRRQQVLGVRKDARYQAHNRNITGVFKILETHEISEGLQAIPARKAGPKHLADLALNIVYKQAAPQLGQFGTAQGIPCSSSYSMEFF